MTIESFKYVMTSKPRRRVALLALFWLVACALKVVKVFLYLPAAPFLRASNALYDTMQAIGNIVGEILFEKEQIEIKKSIEDDEEEL